MHPPVSQKSEIQRRIQFYLDWVLAVALAWFLVQSFLQLTSISGHSMEPTLSAGDVVLVDTLSYNFFQPRRMDIVVFYRNDSTENVKRVVGLPGESVVIQNGHIYINGSLLNSKEISEVSLAGIAVNPVELGQDEFFLIGDNADSSEDSRFANVGNVRKSQIGGKIWFRFRPFPKFGFV